MPRAIRRTFLILAVGLPTMPWGRPAEAGERRADGGPRIAPFGQVWTDDRLVIRPAGDARGFGPGAIGFGAPSYGIGFDAPGFGMPVSGFPPRARRFGRAGLPAFGAPAGLGRR